VAKRGQLAHLRAENALLKKHVEWLEARLAESSTRYHDALVAISQAYAEAVGKFAPPVPPTQVTSDASTGTLGDRIDPRRFIDMPTADDNGDEAATGLLEPVDLDANDRRAELDAREKREREEGGRST
jgi:hypothetical protein